MASTYPTTPDTFTANVDGVDFVLAADMNLVQDAAAALQKVVMAGSAGYNLLADSLTHDMWLRGLTFSDFTDDTYLATCWNGLHNGQQPDVAGTAGGSSDPFTRYLKCTFDSAASQFGIVHFLDAQDSKALRGQTVSLSVDAWGTAVTNLRMAVIEWASTADTLTSDVVGTWGAGNPTLATNWSYIGTPASLVITSSRTRVKVENITISGTVNNLGVFIWTPDLQTSTDVLNIARVKMEVGALASPFAPRLFEDELSKLARYFWKSFAIGTAPAQNVGAGTGELCFMAGSAGAGSQRGQTENFPVVMRGIPAMTFYNPAAANANVRDLNAAADGGAISAGNVTPRCFRVSANGNAGTVVGNILAIHYTADAGL